MTDKTIVLLQPEPTPLDAAPYGTPIKYGIVDTNNICVGVITTATGVLFRDLASLQAMNPGKNLIQSDVVQPGWIYNPADGTFSPPPNSYGPVGGG